jgi:hypothetical protein
VLWQGLSHATYLLATFLASLCRTLLLLLFIIFWEVFFEAC